VAEPNEEAVEAAFLALRDTRACRESHRRDDARAALAAALPLLRSQIADEIRDGWTCAATEPGHVVVCEPAVCDTARKIEHAVRGQS
jgi:hypothetical protein